MKKYGFNSNKGSVTGSLIGIMVTIIIGVAVTITVVQDVIDSAAINGTAGTILGYFPLLIAVVLLVAIVGVAM